MMSSPAHPSHPKQNPGHQESLIYRKGVIDQIALNEVNRFQLPNLNEKGIEGALVLGNGGKDNRMRPQGGKRKKPCADSKVRGEDKNAKK